MKKIILFIVCFCLLFTFCGCDKPTPVPDSMSDSDTHEEPGSKDPMVTLITDKNEYNIGDTIVVRVKFTNFDGVKTFGIYPIFNQEDFEIKEAKILLNATVSGVTGGVGVAAFDSLQKISDTDVFEFSLIAKRSVSQTEIGCDISVKGEDDVSIQFVAPNKIGVKIN